MLSLVTTATAREPAALCISSAFSTNTKSSAPADSTLATPLTRTLPSPTSRAPVCFAISAKVFAIALMLRPRFQTVSVERRRAFRTRLPPPVHPQPLLRIPPRKLLDHFGELRRVGYDVRFFIAGFRQ